MASLLVLGSNQIDYLPSLNTGGYDNGSIFGKIISIVSVFNVLFVELLSSNDSKTRSYEVPVTSYDISRLRTDSVLVCEICTFSELFSLTLMSSVSMFGLA